LVPRAALRFALGFVLSPFQGLIFGVVGTQGDASLCPGLCTVALSGLDIQDGRNPGLRFALPWALFCRPFRAGFVGWSGPRAALCFALGFVLSPFQGLIYRLVGTQGGASLCPGLCPVALSGLDFQVDRNPGLRFALPWALYCRPFRA